MQDEHVWGLKQGSAWDVGSKLSLGLQVEMLNRPPSMAGEWSGSAFGDIFKNLMWSVVCGLGKR